MNEDQPKHFLHRGIDRRTLLKATVLTAAAAFVAPDIAANAAADWKAFLQTEYLQEQPVTTAIFAEYELSGGERKSTENQPFPLYAVVDKANPLKNSPVQFDRNGQLMKGLNKRSEFVQSGKPDQKVVLKGTSILDIARNLAAKNEPGSVQLMFAKAERGGKTFTTPVIRILNQVTADFVVDGKPTQEPLLKGTIIIPNTNTQTFLLYIPPIGATQIESQISQVDTALHDLGVNGVKVDNGSKQTFDAPLGSLSLVQHKKGKNITAVITDKETLQFHPENAISAPEPKAIITRDTTMSPIETINGYHGFETYYDGHRIRYLTNLPPTFSNWDKGTFKQMIDAFNANVPKGGKKIEGDITAIVKARTGKYDDVLVGSSEDYVDYAKTKIVNNINIWTIYVNPDYEERFKNHPTKDDMISSLFINVFPYGMEMSTHNNEFGISTFQNMRQVIQNNNINAASLFTVKR